MNDAKAKKISKLLSLILRHRPETVHIQLDKQGFTSIDELIININRFARLSFSLSREQLEEVVATNDKKRFEISADQTKIRAVQGHSTPQVQRDFPAQIPPNPLYHGTSTKALRTILKEGLLPQTRQYVHLSADVVTARKVGARHGKVCVLQIDTAKMSELGHEFYLAENGVWLVKAVPIEYLTQI